jgi:hypothetical protein
MGYASILLRYHPLCPRPGADGLPVVNIGTVLFPVRPDGREHISRASVHGTQHVTWAMVACDTHCWRWLGRRRRPRGKDTGFVYLPQTPEVDACHRSRLRGEHRYPYLAQFSNLLRGDYNFEIK